MSFPVKLVSILSGATLNQLNRWRRDHILVPEATRGPRGEVRYSFRDIVAARTVVKLRAEVSLQGIRRALENLDLYSEPEHLSAHRLVSSEVKGRPSVALLPRSSDDDAGIDLVRSPGQTFDVPLWKLFRSFKNFRGDDVVDLEHPSAHLEVIPGRLGGWPTVANTRIGYDEIARLQRGDEALRPDEVSEFFPSVSPNAAIDAFEFDTRVQSVGVAS